jgi:hypothetical protein
MGYFIHGRHTGGRAAGTINDFIHGPVDGGTGRQEALWVTSSMDAIQDREGGPLAL